MRILRFVLFALLVLSSSFATSQDESADETQSPRVPPPIIPAMQKPIKVSPNPATVNLNGVVHEGTVVPVRIVSGIKAKEAQPGDDVDLVLDHDLWLGDLLIAKQGSPVQATVVDAAKAKWGSRGSKLAIEISDLKMLNGQSLPLRATMEARGGIGPTAAVSGGLVVDSFSKCPLCAVIFAPAAIVPLVSLALPGTNRNIKANTLATAFVDRDLVINIAEFRKLQANDPQAPAKLVIVRGKYGAWYDRNLYCNGIPLAHLPTHRRFELKVQSGWYRFSINPKKQPLEIFLPSGSETNLITDYEHVYVANEPERMGPSGQPLSNGATVPGGYGIDENVDPANTRSMNTSTAFGHPRKEDEYLRSVRPIEEREVYNRECPPLALAATAP